MPVTIHSGTMKYKNSNGDYVGINSISEIATDELLDELDEKAEEIMESWPSDYTALTNSIAVLNKGFDPRNIAYPVPFDLSGTENDFYYNDPLTWSQGGWDSSGDVTSNYWIRTGLLDGGFIIHNRDPEYGYIVGKFTSAGVFSQYTWMNTLVNNEYYYIPDVGSGYKVKIRQRHMTQSTSALTPNKATIEIFRVTGILKNSLRYIDNSTVEGYATSTTTPLLADVAGNGNSLFTIRGSYWTDVPFGGVGINFQYAANYDAQIVIPLDGNDCAFRIVNRNTKAIYLAWQTLNDKLSSYLKYDNILDSSTYSRLFANVAGAKNLTTNIAFSAWDDVPFGGAAMNIQYTANWDLQVIYALDHNEIAYRFVHRVDHTAYQDHWNLVNGNALNGKKVSIIGDSRSSYTGTVPEGNASYYPRGSGAVLTSVSQMWWRRVIDHFGMELVVNDSYSGGFVADVQIQNPPPAAGILSSDTAIANLGNTAPDIILIFAGVNDWNANQVQIGEYNGTQTFPTDNTTFREALAILISKVQTKFPEADIWLCTNPYCCPNGTGKTVDQMPIPVAGSGGKPLNTFNEAIRDMAKLFGCGIIPFERCGVNWGNLIDYTGDIDSTHGLHYNANGHKLLADVAISTLASSY